MNYHRLDCCMTNVHLIKHIIYAYETNEYLIKEDIKEIKRLLPLTSSSSSPLVHHPSLR